MSDHSSKVIQGYCTNVHAGTTLEQIKDNLSNYSSQVQRMFAPDQPMGLGLWLCNDVCKELIVPNKANAFGNWLSENKFNPFTINGFPYRDFHQPVVKRLVYQPTWAEKERLDYTNELAQIHSRLLSGGLDYGTISTLPLGWSADDSPEFRDKCAENLKLCAETLAELREQTGKHIFLCIEPEPGCVFQTSGQLVEFFQQHLLNGNDESNQRMLDFIGVCHDVCHSAVMFEPQKAALDLYHSNNIRIGKVQVSSAVAADFGHQCDEEQADIMTHVLHQFAEDRYLHQTVIYDGGTTVFFEDLNLALQQHGRKPFGSWRVHYHVPIFTKQLTVLETTQSEIHDCVAWFAAHSKELQHDIHFEIETYAWSVLPETLRSKSLGDDIAREMIWFRDSCMQQLS